MHIIMRKAFIYIVLFSSLHLIMGQGLFCAVRYLTKIFNENTSLSAGLEKEILEEGDNNELNENEEDNSEEENVKEGFSEYILHAHIGLPHYLSTSTLLFSQLPLALKGSPTEIIPPPPKC